MLSSRASRVELTEEVASLILQTRVKKSDGGFETSCISSATYWVTLALLTAGIELPASAHEGPGGEGGRAGQLGEFLPLSLDMRQLTCWDSQLKRTRTSRASARYEIRSRNTARLTRPARSLVRLQEGDEGEGPLKVSSHHHQDQTSAGLTGIQCAGQRTRPSSSR